jgi:putative transposase
MPEYRRYYQNGATYFFTIVTFQRQPIFKEDSNVKLLMDCLDKIMRTHPFEINASVILPDHLHMIWTFPGHDCDFSTRWNLIKGNFSRGFKDSEVISTKSRLKKRERAVWQRRFWEHLIRDQNDYNDLCDYIHYNPVKHGYTNSPLEWKYSTFKQFVEKGLFPENRDAIKINNFTATGPD